jgi:hypothetical protein
MPWPRASGLRASSGTMMLTCFTSRKTSPLPINEQVMTNSHSVRSFTRGTSNSIETTCFSPGGTL